MADPKDNQTTPASTPKAGKSAAVKPPVLEGTARPADTPKPAEKSKAEAAKPNAAKPEAIKSDPAKAELPPKPEVKPPVRPEAESRAGTAWLAGLAGGVIGLGAAYGLAYLGYWPSSNTPPAQPDSSIVAIEAAIPELQTVTSTVQDELSTLNSRVAALESSGGSGAADPALADQLTVLTQRVEELATTQTNVSGANPEDVSALQTELTTLREDTNALANQLTDANRQIATLEDQLAAGVTAQQGQARLPLILSGFETAFAAGRPYDGELAALRQALPEFVVAPEISAASLTGLTPPDQIQRAFNAKLPSMLTVRAQSGDESWQNAASEWFRGVIAIRPAEPVDGTGVEAIISRLEAAVAARDFNTAAAEFNSLPSDMQALAGETGTAILAQAAAQNFLNDLRATALTEENGA